MTNTNTATAGAANHRDASAPPDSLEGGAPDAANEFWYEAFEGFRRFTGIPVTPRTAEQLAAVYACKTGITESIAMLPAAVFEDLNERTRSKVRDHYLYRLLTDQPNDFQDSFQFFEQMQDSALDDGNAYAHKTLAKSGKILALLPLPYDRMRVLFANGRRSYEYRQPNGARRIYEQDEIFHFFHHSKDGLTGRSPIKVVSDVIGNGIALQQHGLQIFENGAFLAGFIKVAKGFKDDAARRQFMDGFKQYMGSIATGKYALLEQGAEFAPLSQTNKDAQFLEAKQASVLDIARIFRMPPHMIQDLSQGASYSSIEQQSINFVTYTIQPWITRWEHAIKRWLLNGEPYYLKFNASALMRGDYKSRVEALVQQVQYGLKSINEARALEDDNPIDSEIGDKTLISTNLQDAAKMLNPPKVEEPKKEPVAPPPPASEDPEEVDPAEEQPKSDRAARFAPLFEDILGRLNRRMSETYESVRKRGGDQADVLATVPRHLEIARRQLVPACFAATPDDSEARLDRFMEEYDASLRTGIEARFQQNADEFGECWPPLDIINPSEEI